MTNNGNNLGEGLTASQVADLEQSFGRRMQPPIDDSALLYSRFNYAIANFDESISRDINSYGADGVHELVDLSHKSVGIVPRIRARFIWEKAQEFYKGKLTDVLRISHSKWDKILERLEDYAMDHGKKESTPLLVQHIWAVSEQDFCEMFFENGTGLVQLINSAVLADIAESKDIQNRWRKIKRYPYKVALELERGGLFSTKDAAILRQHGIRYLNDIRRINIYMFKDMFLDYPVKNLPEDLNAAFKEDYERRKDRRYKVCPFVFGFLGMVATSVVLYNGQYTLIKDKPATAAVFALLALWLSMIAVIIRGAIRAKKRRRTKRPDYYYFTNKVKTTFTFFVLASVFVLCSASVFYERYDGYDSNVYYRNLGDDKIAVAGVIDSDRSSLNITSTIDGKTVVEIDFDSFRNNKSLVEVTIPSTVTYIDRNAFYKCESLRSVYIPGSVEEIGYSAFAKSSALSSLNIPEGVKIIGKSAFKDCIGLSSVEIPSTLREVRKDAFNGCVNLHSLSFGKNLVYIGERAFKGCESVTSITVDDTSNIKVIPKSLFEGCSNLTSTNLFDNATRVESRALANCTSLKSFVLSDQVEQIDKDVFTGCTALSELTVPFVGKSATDSRGLTYLVGGGSNLATITVTKAEKISSNMASNMSNIKEIRLLCNITEIPNRAFYNNSSLESVVVRGNIQSIGNGAFEKCSSLKSFSISDGVTSIGDSAFKDCSSLTSIAIPSTVNSVGKEAFRGCVKLASIEFAGVLHSIGQGAFMNCESATSITANDVSNLTVIPKSAFENCFKLTNTNLFDNVTSVESRALANCRSLETFTLGNKVEKLGKGVFEGCSGLNELSVPFMGSKFGDDSNFTYLLGSETTVKQITLTNIDKVAKNAFKNMTSLTQIRLFSNITEIGEGAFSGCSRLVSVTIPNGIREIKRETFADCLNLTRVDGIENIETLGASAFRNCIELTSLNLGNVTSVGDSCFSGCRSMTQISLPKAESFGNYAFEGCSQLEEFVFYKSEAKIGTYLFKNCTELTEATLPSSVTAVPAGTFYGCKSISYANFSNVQSLGKEAFSNSGLESFSFGSALEKVGEQCFAYCTNLKTLVVPSTVKEIGKHAFEGVGFDIVTLSYVGKNANSTSNGFEYLFGQTPVNTLVVTDMKDVDAKTFKGAEDYLKNLVLKGEITSIKDGAFKKMTGLQSISLPNTVTSIGKEAFANCENLTALTLPQSVQNLGQRFAKGCYRLKEVTLPYGITFIPKQAFEDCRGLLSIELPATVGSVGEGAFRGCTNLDAIAGVNLRIIEKGAFSNSGLKEFTLCEDIKEIGDSAFSYCSKLESISCNDALEKIGKYAFEGCVNLTTVNFNNSLQTIERGAFRDCAALTEVTIPDGISTIGKHVFDGCTNLRKISTPFFGKTLNSNGRLSYLTNSQSVSAVYLTKANKVANNAFKNYENLSVVYLNSNVESIGRNAFRNCMRLEVVQNTSNVKTIASRAFYNSGLRSFTLGQEVTSIGNKAFYGCSYLHSFVCNDNLKTIGVAAFKNCSALETVSFNQGLETIKGYAFQNCQALTSVFVPKSVTKIGYHVFDGCSRLKTLSVPFVGRTVNRNRRIDYITDSYELTTVYVTNAKEIARKAFMKCYYLYEVHLNNGITKIGADAFDSCERLRIIYIPRSLADEYRDVIPRGVSIYYTENEEE